MRRYWILALLMAILASLPAPKPATAQEADGIIHARLYWMAGCPHCDYIMAEVLPPLQAQYGDQLEIEVVELVSISDVNSFYEMAQSLGIPKADVGVPLIMVGEHLLLGQEQIEAQLPALLAEYAAQGGVALAPEQVSVSSADAGLCLPDAGCDDRPPAWVWIMGFSFAALTVFITAWIFVRRQGKR